MHRGYVQCYSGTANDSLLPVKFINTVNHLWLSNVEVVMQCSRVMMGLPMTHIIKLALVTKLVRMH